MQGDLQCLFLSDLQCLFLREQPVCTRADEIAPWSTLQAGKGFLLAPPHCPMPHNRRLCVSDACITVP
eukprot:5225142-Pyramimonas_sp.AAC.1